MRLAGRMLREARAGRAPRPVVGDWVELSPDGIVVTLRPRRTRLARKAAGLRDVEQVIVANVDVAFVATSIDGDVNERRLERYLALVHEGGVVPVVLLTKVGRARGPRGGERPACTAWRRTSRSSAVSARTGQGLDEWHAASRPDRAAVLLGSSGVGKSTLVNRLARRVAAARRGAP